MIIKRLPNWVITSKYPAFFDFESLTATEQTARVYAKMNEFIDAYNSYVNDLNQQIEEFEASVNKDFGCFTTKIINLTNDYIATVQLKLNAQDRKIEDYYKAFTSNVLETIGNMVEQLKQSGELDTVVLNAVGELDSKFTQLQQNFDLLYTDYEVMKESLQEDYNETKSALNTDYEGVKSDLSEEYTGTLNSLTTNYEGVKSTLQEDYNETKSALNTDYEETKSTLQEDYNETKSALNTDYVETKSTLDTDYENTKSALNSDYQTTKSHIQTDFNNFMAEGNETLENLQEFSDTKNYVENQEFNKDRVIYEGTMPYSEYNTDDLYIEVNSLINYRIVLVTTPYCNALCTVKFLDTDKFYIRGCGVNPLFDAGGGLFGYINITGTWESGSGSNVVIKQNQCCGKTIISSTTAGDTISDTYGDILATTVLKIEGIF